MSGRRSAKRPLVAASALAALLAPYATAAAAGQAATARAAGSVLSSRQLWATINVCNPTDQPEIVGVRGSMPSDGHARDRMYMSFRLQYLSTATNHWADLAGATPVFISVGSGTARQGGQSFQLMPAAGRPAFTLRGLVEFQWRRGRAVLQSTRRPTSAGHVSLAGADPRGFSAATCRIG
ncbi:MAG TPA: hypothetical protein VHY83_11125 [Solirubrobacteraceae bacterium]|nr:hypothetical protein [Solirubrobacteraceae bacterium]